MLALFVSLAVAAAPPLTLEHLLTEVSQNAPQLRSQEEAVAAARASQAAAGAWEDPTLEIMAEDVPLPGAMRMEPELMQPMLTYRFRQPLNLFGRRRLAKEAAAARVGMEQSALRRVEWNARAEAARGFYELWMNGQTAEILDRQIETLRRMRDAARARYAAGLTMGHHEVLRAESELAAMGAERDSLADERAAVAAMVNALRNKPQDEPLGDPVLPARAPLADLAFALERAERTPELDSARRMQAEMEARRGLAERMYLPMVMGELFYEQRVGPGPFPDSWGGAVAFTVPLWWFDRQRPEVEMAKAMVRRAQRELEAMRAMTQAEVRAAYSRAKAAERTLQAIEQTALPRMRETVASSLAGYVSGSAEFLLLLESSMALRNLEMERVRAVVRREIARYELARLLGAPLEAP